MRIGTNQAHVPLIAKLAHSHITAHVPSNGNNGWLAAKVPRLQLRPLGCNKHQQVKIVKTYLFGCLPCELKCFCLLNVQPVGPAFVF